ncbi:MAG TPA: mechanosensitive ion channel family protein [Myxococcales bacterium]|nr:mechanosensitive ion channel family protein [Myxococcales bacterium]
MLLLAQATPSRATSMLREILGDIKPRSLVIVAVMLIAAALLNRLVNSFVHRNIEHHRANGTLLPESATRLQISRRILDAIIWIVAISISLTQFPELRVFSAGLLASAGISGLIVGFAARSTLGNAVAGVTIAFAQPVRIGDEIELRGDRGVVQDITLLYTVVGLWDGKRLIIPNDTLSTEVIKNLTLGSVARNVRVDVLVPPKGDARAVTEGLLGVAASEPGLDRNLPKPRVEILKVDAAGALLRLSATCSDAAAAERLTQAALAKAAQLVYGIQV